MDSLRRRILVSFAVITLWLGINVLFDTIDRRAGYPGAAVSFAVASLPMFSLFLHLKDVLLPHSVESEMAKYAIRNFLIPPVEAFDPKKFPEPNYFDEAEAWNALPWSNDTADEVPPHCGVDTCTKENQKDARVDLFFLGPSTFYSHNEWLVDSRSKATQYLIREAIIPQQAAPFNSVARIFSPQIRQMTGFAYFADRGGEVEATRVEAAQIAYRDARNAFQHYMTHWNGGRKVILAGHSQGAEYILRILRDEFGEGKPHRDKLAAAYVVGMPVYRSVLKRWGIPACMGPGDVGCVVSWQTYSEGADPRMFYFETTDPELRRAPNETHADRLCTNPLSWYSNNETYVDASHSRGGMHIVQWMQNLYFLLGWTPADDQDLELTAMETGMAALTDPPAATLARIQTKRQINRVKSGLLGLKPFVVGARCQNGSLFVDPPPRGEWGSSPWYTIFPAWRFGSFPAANLHPYDFNYFWNNIRHNAELRVSRLFASS